MRALVLLVLVCGCAAPIAPDPLLGKWLPEDKDSSVEFLPSGTMVLAGTVSVPYRKISAGRFAWRPKPQQNEVIGQYKFEGDTLLMNLTGGAPTRRFKRGQ